MQISIIIVTWNGKRYAEECLDSLHAYINDPRAEVIVVDNASTDGTPEMIEHSYPGVMLIRNDKNLGFAKANNVGIRKSSGEFVLLVNSDVVVREGCIERLVPYMKSVSSISPTWSRASRRVTQNQPFSTSTSATRSILK